MTTEINWEKYNTSDVTILNSTSYIVRIIDCKATNVKFYTCYSDLNIDIVAYNVNNKKNIIGYVINVKDKSRFKILLRKHYLQIIDKKVKEHSNPQLIYCTKKVHLYKFNENEHESYWFTCRISGNQVTID